MIHLFARQTGSTRMKLLTFAVALCLTSSASIAADDALLQYLTGLPFYSSDVAIAPDLVEQLKRACTPARSFTLRQAVLLESAFDRKVQIVRTRKEGPSYEEPVIGPQPGGFLLTIGLFSNRPSITNGKRQEASRVDKFFVMPERSMKWGRATIPTKDKSQFYSIYLEAGLEVSDETFDKIIVIVSEYAKK